MPQSDNETLDDDVICFLYCVAELLVSPMRGSQLSTEAGRMMLAGQAGVLGDRLMTRNYQVASDYMVATAKHE